eukprot:CAMPEP_0173064038 /NCGR_PEP_ID=MMETSP1102-20130122/4763_1 /TAXON_ID=49646 /ORGANISM="Geminigera sp., Strain Caron Lab Isolate" /LENGTH=158 /DNA_ID=CAMNT_0013930999 /DNA_START=303 /DNA_END=779 /DNA_ORIENTATION=+
MCGKGTSRSTPGSYVYRHQQASAATTRLSISGVYRQSDELRLMLAHVRLGNGSFWAGLDAGILHMILSYPNHSEDSGYLDIMAELGANISSESENEQDAGGPDTIRPVVPATLPSSLQQQPAQPPPSHTQTDRHTPPASPPRVQCTPSSSKKTKNDAA